MQAPWEELEPASRSAVERQRQAVRQIDFFSSAVFAVSMALQLLLLIEHTSVAAREVASLAETLRAVWPALCAGAVGLLMLLSYWLLHHLQFNYLTRSSGTALLIHALLLPSVLIVPLSTTLLQAFGLTEHAVLLLTANALLIQALLLVNWRHAVRGGLLFGSDVPPRVVVRIGLLLRLSVFAVLVACLLALVNPTVSLSLLIGILIGQVAIVAAGGYVMNLGIPPRRARD